MTKGLFTTSEEIKFHKDLMTPVARPSIRKREKFKPLFSSQEEVSFQQKYVQGNVEPARDPNTKRAPAKTKSLCTKKPCKQVQKVILGRTR